MSGGSITHTEMKFEVIRHNIKATRDLISSTSSFSWSITNKYGGNLNTSYIVGVYGRVITPFTGIAGPVYLSIADESASYVILDKTNVMIARTDSVLFSHCPTIAMLHVECQQYPRYQYACSTPVVTIASDSGNLSSLTAGEVEIILVTLV
jgi:hypothetical protein